MKDLKEMLERGKDTKEKERVDKMMDFLREDCKENEEENINSAVKAFNLTLNHGTDLEVVTTMMALAGQTLNKVNLDHIVGFFNCLKATQYILGDKYPEFIKRVLVDNEKALDCLDTALNDIKSEEEDSKQESTEGKNLRGLSLAGDLGDLDPDKIKDMDLDENDFDEVSQEECDEKEKKMGGLIAKVNDKVSIYENGIIVSGDTPEEVKKNLADFAGLKNLKDFLENHTDKEDMN